MGHLGYNSLKTFKNHSSGIDFNKTVLKKLYEDCRKKDQTR